MLRRVTEFLGEEVGGICVRAAGVVSSTVADPFTVLRIDLQLADRWGRALFVSPKQTLARLLQAHEGGLT